MPEFIFWTVLGLFFVLSELERREQKRKKNITNYKNSAMKKPVEKPKPYNWGHDIRRIVGA